VEGSLAGAFAKRRGEDVRQLVAMMVSIGRSGTVEKLYNAARLAPLQVYKMQNAKCSKLKLPVLGLADSICFSIRQVV